MEKQAFIEWINEEEDKRGWTDNKLAKKAGISPSVFTKARQGTVPKWDACLAIAHALDISPVTVFRKAGLLPEKLDTEVTFEDWEHLLLQLSPHEQEILRQNALTLLELKKKNAVTPARLNGMPVKS